MRIEKKDYKRPRSEDVQPSHGNAVQMIGDEDVEIIHETKRHCGTKPPLPKDFFAIKYKATVEDLPLGRSRLSKKWDSQYKKKKNPYLPSFTIYNLRQRKKPEPKVEKKVKKPRKKPAPNESKAVDESPPRLTRASKAAKVLKKSLPRLSPVIQVSKPEKLPVEKVSPPQVSSVVKAEPPLKLSIVNLSSIQEPSFVNLSSIDEPSLINVSSIQEPSFVKTPSSQELLNQGAWTTPEWSFVNSWLPQDLPPIDSLDSEEIFFIDDWSAEQLSSEEAWVSQELPDIMRSLHLSSPPPLEISVSMVSPPPQDFSDIIPPPLEFAVALEPPPQELTFLGTWTNEDLSLQNSWSSFPDTKNSPLQWSSPSQELYGDMVPPTHASPLQVVPPQKFELPPPPQQHDEWIPPLREEIQTPKDIGDAIDYVCFALSQIPCRDGASDGEKVDWDHLKNLAIQHLEQSSRLILNRYD